MLMAWLLRSFTTHEAVCIPVDMRKCIHICWITIPSRIFQLKYSHSLNTIFNHSVIIMLCRGPIPLVMSGNRAKITRSFYKAKITRSKLSQVRTSQSFLKFNFCFFPHHNLGVFHLNLSVFHHKFSYNVSTFHHTSWDDVCQQAHVAVWAPPTTPSKGFNRQIPQVHMSKQPGTYCVQLRSSQQVHILYISQRCY